MRLIVGLGNPGREYVGTRHNVGFEVVDALAERLGWVRPGDFDRLAKAKFEGLAFEGLLTRAAGDDERLILLKPITFMNDSGRSVKSAMSFYKIAPPDVLVVLDDLALPCGKLRLRPVGSSGGHNGLKDIRRALGTDDYPRLRIGIDAPPGRIPGRDYVLQRFSDDQRATLDLSKAAGACATWADAGIEKAMNQFNAGE